MPIAKVKMPDGRIGRFEVPEGTTPDQVIQFAQQQNIGAPAQPEIKTALLQTQGEIPQEPTGFPGAGILEPAATFVTGALAEPLAGIAGLAKTITSGPEAGTETIEAVRKAFTFQPRTEKGAEKLRGAGELLAPIGEALQGAEQFLGDETFEATGSPALAAAATTLPTVVMEALGLASTKGVLKIPSRTKRLVKNRAVRKAIVESAPEIDQLKNTSRAVYQEIKDAGVTIKPQAFKELNNQIKQTVKEAGFRKTLAPKTARVLKELEGELGKAQTLVDIDDLQKIAKGAAGPLDPNDLRLTGIISDQLDDFLSNAPDTAFLGGKKQLTEILPKRKIAQQLWGKAKKSELIQDAFKNADEAKRGFEATIGDEFRKIIKNKKQNRYFSPDELDVMRKVSKGTTPIKIAQLLGKFDITSGTLTSLIGSGLASSVAGIPGGLLILGVGTVSKRLAGRLTKGNAAFANAVIRAGNNADDIARAYLSKVPKVQRTSAELSELFLRSDIALDTLKISKTPLLKEAAEIALGRRALIAAGIGGGVGVTREAGKPSFLDRLKNIPAPTKRKLPEGTLEANGGNRLQRQLGITSVGPS